MNSTCIEEQHDLDHYLFPIVYIFVLIISIPANIGSLCVSFLQAKKGNELGIYLFSLSLSDLLYAFSLPLWIYYTWSRDKWTFPSELCKGNTFFMFLNFYSSSAFLTSIAVDRYLAVAYPLKFPFLRTRKFAFMVSLFLWVLETIINGIVLWEDDTAIEYCNASSTGVLGWERTEGYKFNSTLKNILCYDKYPLEKWQVRHNLIRTFTGYAIPLVIIVICNQKVYQAVKHNQATENKEKKKIIRLLFCITATFVLCFTPFHVMLLIRSILEHDTQVIPQFLQNNTGKQTYKIYRITVALTSLNCVADPILYCFVTEMGRSDIRNILKFCTGKFSKSQKQSKTTSTSSKVSVELGILE